MSTSIRFFSALLVLVALPACSSSDRTCDADGLARAAAGDNAIACGTVAIGADRSAVDACVLHAFTAHQPFYARYDMQGIDSKGARLEAGDASGRVFLLTWDGDPSGGSQTHETVDQVECTSPNIDLTANNAGFTCASAMPNVRVCGG